MSESKHTPGPWRWVNGEHLVSDGALLTLFKGAKWHNGNVYDAALIAVAPELLATIIECRKQIDSIIEDGTPTDWRVWRDDLDALIAKAGAA